MMNYKSTGQNQRPKGFKVKQALQLALLLAICIWLLYQIKHSWNEKKDFDRNTQSKLNEVLGRKGNAGGSNDGGHSDSEDVNVVGVTEKKEDEDLARNPEVKAEAESYLEEKENVANHEVKGDEKEPEREYTESRINEDSNADIQVKGVEALSLNKDMYDDVFLNKGHENEPGSEIDLNTTVVQEKDEAVKENYEEEGPKEMLPNIAGQGHIEMEDGVYSFHDENGVPRDDIDESNGAESSDDQRSNEDRAMIDNSNNRSRMVESIPVEEEDDESTEGSIAAYAENEGKDTL